MVQRIAAEIILLVVQLHLRTEAAHVHIDDLFDLATACLYFSVGVAQLLNDEGEELRRVLEVVVLLDEVFEFVGAGELVEVVPDALREILRLGRQLPRCSS